LVERRCSLDGGFVDTGVFVDGIRAAVRRHGALDGSQARETDFALHHVVFYEWVGGPPVD